MIATSVKLNVCCSPRSDLFYMRTENLIAVPKANAYYNISQYLCTIRDQCFDHLDRCDDNFRSWWRVGEDAKATAEHCNAA